VLAGVVTLMLVSYQGALAALAHLLPVGNVDHLHLAATGVAQAVNAFTQQPVRRWIERQMDRAFSRSAKATIIRRSVTSTELRVALRRPNQRRAA